MNRKKSSFCIFDVIAICITASVVVFVTTALLSIVLGGYPHIMRAATSDEIHFSVKLSLYTATISSILCVLIAVPCGYALTRTCIPLKNLVSTVIELPISMPYLVLGLALLAVFSSPFGKELREWGFDVVFSRNGIIMAQLIVNLPFAVKLIRTEISKLDSRLEFIAGMLGASRWRRFTDIIIPQCRVAILMTFILVWSRGMGEFGATLMLVGVTRFKTETLPASIYLNISTGDNGMAMAAAMIMLVISAATLAITSFCGKKLQDKSRIARER